jgi:hypothetical protein
MQFGKTIIGHSSQTQGKSTQYPGWCCIVGLLQRHRKNMNSGPLDMLFMALAWLSWLVTSFCVQFQASLERICGGQRGACCAASN